MLVDFYFAQKTFFPKNLLSNSGCGLSTDAAYTRVNTVKFLFASDNLKIAKLTILLVTGPQRIELFDQC